MTEAEQQTQQRRIHFMYTPCDLLKASIKGCMASQGWLKTIITTKLSVRLIRGSVHLTQKSPRTEDHRGTSRRAIEGKVPL